MSNLAKIVKASKDPRCIMSIIPTDGGTWASSISSITPQPVTAGADLNEPNMSKRLKLLELTNTDTSGGVFKSADLTQPNWYGKTALSLAGRSTSFTVIAKAYIAPDNGGVGYNATEYDTNPYHPLLSQGRFLSGNSAYWVYALFYDKKGENRIIHASCYGDTGSFGFQCRLNERTLNNQIVTIAATDDFSTGTKKVYLDGVLMHQQSVPRAIGATMQPDTSAAQNNDELNIRQVLSPEQNRNDKIYWAMVFDGILPDATIKYLST